MRKIFLVMLILSLLLITAGCGNELSDDTFNVVTTNDTDVNDATIITGDLNIYETDWCDIDLNPMFPVDVESRKVLDEIKPINTNEMAIEVGTSIIVNLHEQGSFPDFVLVGIVHSTEDNVWRFEYSIDYRASINAALTFCECFYVAVDGNDGSIIQAWIEE